MMKPFTSGIALAVCAICFIAMLAGPTYADARKTPFTGTETVVGGLPPTIIPAGDKFHVLITQYAEDTATDERISGNSTIIANAIWELPAMIGPMWGTWRLVNSGGEWNGHWQGSRTLVGEDIVTSIVTTSVGSSGYEGLIARWNISGVNVGPDNPQLTYDGFIVEATKGHVALPVTYRGTRTESLNLSTLEFDVLSETGRGTHLGNSTNSGLGFAVPISATDGLLMATGILVAANGDKVYWVAEGMLDLTLQNGATVSVYFAGGTGRFEYVVGKADSIIFASFGPPDENNVIVATYSYTATGTIRY